MAHRASGPFAPYSPNANFHGHGWQNNGPLKTSMASSPEPGHMLPHKAKKHLADVIKR